MIDQAKRPKGDAWRFYRQFHAHGFPVDIWLCGDLSVCSSREPLEDKRTGLVLPTFQVSVSKNRARPDDEAVRSALADFDMEGADEDNHSPGIARHFWLIDDGRTKQPECECKETEETIVEPDGFKWQKERNVPHVQ